MLTPGAAILIPEEITMAEDKKITNVREGVIKYTKPPLNRTPPSQRPGHGSSTTTAKKG